MDEYGSRVDWQARDEAIAREKENLDRAHPIDGWDYRVTRFFVRLGRIACGVVLLVISFILFGNTPSVSDTPFAALTLSDVFGAFFGAMFGILFLYWAFIVAFGEKPNQQERHRQDAIKNVDVRARTNGGRF